MPSPVDEIARGFAPTPVDPKRYNDGGITLEPGEAFALLLELIPPSSRVLDVGCGSGGFGAVLACERNCDVVGIEPSPERAERARERGLNVRTGFFDASTTDGIGRFDVVVFADVLEHLADPLAALQLAVSMLQPRGAVVASVPNVAHWTIRLDLLRGHFRYQTIGLMDATHLRWFTRETLTKLVETAGLLPTTTTVSAGRWMSEYDHRRPWKWLSKKRRDRLLDRLVRWKPTVFGCQHIIRAELPTN